MKTKNLLIILFAAPYLLFGQNKTPVTYSLKKSIEIAVANNLTLKNSKLDADIANKKNWEYTAYGLPQVNAGADYQYFIDIPTTLMEDFITKAIVGTNFGLGLISMADPKVQEMLNSANQMFPIQFGTKQNASWDVSVSQLIFSGQYIIGLSAFKQLKILSQQTAIKTEKDIIASITQSYYLVLMLEENKKILKQSIEVLQKTYNEMKAMNVSGFVDETSVDQLKLTLSGVENVEKSMSRQLEVSYNLLKYNMGVSLEENIALSDNLETLFNIVNADTYVNQKFNKDNNINFQLLYTAEKLSKLNMKKEIMTFLPQLSAFYSYKRGAMGNEFNFFDSGTKWFPTQVIGISLKVPIFSSGMRYAKYQQAKLDLEKTRNTKKLVADGLELEYQQAKSEFSNALEKYVTEKENKVLAQKIYDNTLIKFKQGVGSSMDLTQANNQLISSQTNFIKAMFDFLNSKNRIDKVLNNY